MLYTFTKFTSPKQNRPTIKSNIRRDLIRKKKH